MASSTFDGNGYKMGPRIYIRDVNPSPVPKKPRLMPATLVPRDDDKCAENANLCEKPIGSNSKILPIVLGILIPLVLALGLLYYLHRRGVLKQRREEAADPNQDLDFGLDENGAGGKGGKRKSMFREKMGLDPKHRTQVSMDMNLSSPYLLPPALQNSHESLHSLARNLHSNEDPYRPVNDVGSLRSYRPGKEGGAGSSTYSGSTERQSTVTGRTLPPRQNSLPRPPPPAADPFGTPTSGAMTPTENATPTSPTRGPFPLPQGIVPEIGTVPYPDDGPHQDASQIPDIPSPPPAATKIPRKAISGTSQSSWGDAPISPPPRSLDRPSPMITEEPTQMGGERSQAETTSNPLLPGIGVGLGLDDMTFPLPQLNSDPRTGSADTARGDSYASPPHLPTIIPEETNAYDDRYDSQGYQNQSYQDFEGVDQGQLGHRRSLEGNYRDSQALGVPQQDDRRLSVGLRPLPPDEMMESEDPEERANRIRSFYKEYFDDSKPADPAGPAGGAQYQEDYDPGYLGDSTFYDPDSNAFVMPYSQPVTRRAMTPPPGPRNRGPPPPRIMHGSMGGMGPPGARRPPPPRAGTSMSGRWGGPPTRPGSSMSSVYGQPRPGSSVSNRFQQRPSKPKGPPPATLTTLPNPSKLKDDSMALLGAIDFAPPDTYEDRQRGRSQSPMGERRPYAPKVPVASPLISSYDEMAAIPSPHLLRKSGTFTGLDFAPPRKFANDDTMSDAGSIRSNRSGISAMQAHAIRSGAGRVSRLPDDTVFTQAKLEKTLKPSWNMRD